MKTNTQGKGAATPLKSWTIAVFMVGEPQIQFSMKRDLIELRSVGSREEVDVVVAQQKTAGAKTHFFVIPEGTMQVPSTPVKEGDPIEGHLEERLDEFLRFVLEKHPAEHYLLVMWGHAGGLGFGQPDSKSDADLTTLDELAKSLEKFRKARKGPDQGKKLEILGFCACALSKVEFALELREEVDFLVSSQIGISTLTTWPFDEILDRLVNSPSMSPQAFASQIVRCFETSYEPPPIALTALQLGKVENLRTMVDNLSESILNVTGGADTISPQTFSTLFNADGTLNLPAVTGLPAAEMEGFTSYLAVFNALNEAIDAFPYQHEELVDFYDFCQTLLQQPLLGDKVRRASMDVVSRGIHPFVFQNARSGLKLGALNGLSIIAPNFEDKNWVTTWEAAHVKKAWFWEQTRWPQMTHKLHAFAMRLPPALLEAN